MNVSFDISLKNMGKPIINSVIHPKYEAVKTQLVDCINRFYDEGDVVLKGERNTIKSLVVNGEKLNIKAFKTPNWLNSFVYKYIRKSKAERSYEYANHLIGKGVLTPFPLAYFEMSTLFGLKQSFYISRHIDYDFDVRNLIHELNFPNRNEVLRQLTKFTFQLHENDINFLDHSPGNTLIVKKENNNYDFYLIDLNRMRFEVMDFDKRMHNFRRLWLSKAMVKIMAKTYAELYHKTFEETHQLMLKHSRNFQCKIDAKKLRRSGRKMRFKS